MKAVFKHFPGKNVLNSLDFSAASGQVVGLLGRNGAGKSTMLQCALGLSEIDSGSVTIFGEQPNNFSEEVKGKIGYVPQQVDLFQQFGSLQRAAGADEESHRPETANDAHEAEHDSEGEDHAEELEPRPAGCRF